MSFCYFANKNSFLKSTLWVGCFIYSYNISSLYVHNYEIKKKIFSLSLISIYKLENVSNRNGGRRHFDLLDEPKSSHEDCMR